jgi:nucleotide-binding universal stress UspA family protein
MFKRILLPTDGSEFSAAAIRQGIRLAKSIGAKVTGLCVMPMQIPFFYQKRMPKEALEEADQQDKKLAETYLAVVEQGAIEAGVAYDLVFENSEHPYDKIIRVAEEKGCDLIMMASHGRRGVPALLIGSETQKVLTHSKIPVLVFRGT